jgi:hypothetical protein
MILISASYLFIVCAFCPHLWKYELLLQEIEEHLEIILLDGKRDKLRKLLYKLGNRMFRMMKDSLLQSEAVRFDRLIDILEMISMDLSFNENDLKRLEQLPFCNWFFELKSNFWSSMLKLQDPGNQKEALYLLLELENKKGKEFCLKLVKDLDQEIPGEFVKILHANLYGDGQLKQTERSMQEIIGILDKEKNNETSTIVRTLKKKTQNKDIFCSTEKEAETYLQEIIGILDKEKNIETSTTVSTLKEKAQNEEKFDSFEKEIWLKPPKKLSFPADAEEFLSHFNAVVKQKMNFCLRSPQQIAILAVLTSTEDTQNILAQVSTGEGKSLIVAGLAIARALSGIKVDVTTSSPLLAIRDSTLKTDKGGLLDIYQSFGVSVSHNCSPEEEKRQKAYNSQVVYGELANFQRDFLLQTFYGKNIKGDRTFDCIIVDEVDCMLLDRGSDMLYLSHMIPGLEGLECLLVNIWQKVNTPNLSLEEIKSDILFDLFGQIKREDLSCVHSSLKCGKTDRDHVWAHLVQSKIIDAQGKLLVKNSSEVTKETINYSQKPELNSKLAYFLKGIVNREQHIKVPNHLLSFVELHLDTYLNNAMQAVFLQPDANYVIDYDRSRRSEGDNFRNKFNIHSKNSCSFFQCYNVKE